MRLNLLEPKATRIPVVLYHGQPTEMDVEPRMSERDFAALCEAIKRLNEGGTLRLVFHHLESRLNVKPPELEWDDVVW